MSDANGSKVEEGEKPSAEPLTDKSILANIDASTNIEAIKILAKFQLSKITEFGELLLEKEKYIEKLQTDGNKSKFDGVSKRGAAFGLDPDWLATLEIKTAEEMVSKLEAGKNARISTKDSTPGDKRSIDESQTGKKLISDLNAYTDGYSKIVKKQKNGHFDSTEKELEEKKPPHIDQPDPMTKAMMSMYASSLSKYQKMSSSTDPWDAYAKLSKKHNDALKKENE